MVFDVNSLLPAGKAFVSGGVNIITYVIVGIAILAVLVSAGLVLFFRNRWNLDVEFKLTRNDGRFLDAEWGKGFYDSKKGVVFLKRANLGKFARGVPMKVPDIRRYLQGTKILTVIQVGPEDFRPVLYDSWSENTFSYIDENGQTKEVKESILNLKVDSGLNKAWRTAWDSAARTAYSIRSMLQQYQVPISIGIVVICCFVGFAILWSKVN